EESVRTGSAVATDSSATALRCAQRRRRWSLKPRTRVPRGRSGSGAGRAMVAARGGLRAGEPAAARGIRELRVSGRLGVIVGIAAEGRAVVPPAVGPALPAAVGVVPAR